MPEDADGTIALSVVMPVRDGAATIVSQLDALARQETTCAWELVVADNGSIDRTAQLVRSHPLGGHVPVRIVDAGVRPGPNAARNVGVRHARGGVVLCCDCDDEVRPGWIDAYWRALADAPPSVAAGPVDLARLNDPRITTWGDRRDEPTVTPTGFTFGWGCNMAFHRAAWQQVDGFDESYAVGFDEIDFFARAFEAGVPFVWVPGARVDYRLSSTLRGTMSKAFAAGRGGIRFRRQHPGSGMPAWTLRRAAWSALAAAGRAVTTLRSRPLRTRHLRQMAYAVGTATEIAAPHLPAARRLSRRQPPASASPSR